MKIHEYQAKELLADAGAAVPAGVVVSSPDEAMQAFDKLGGPVVLKAQVHAGGRGKGSFKGSGKDYGGVKFIKTRAEAGEVAETMFRYPLVTKQTGEEGQKVSKVLVVQAAAKIAREVYVGVVLDRAIGLPIVMACAEGGVEIEEVAAQHPEKILKRTIDPDAGIHPFQARRLAYDLGFTGEQAPKAEKIITALAKVFLDKDCSLAEINPLVTTADGDVQVLDAKITFDDNALFRHPELEKLRDVTEEDPAEMRAASAGLSYINLTGDIGCLVNGAGLAMSTMDIIKYHGGSPANFLDVGGGANEKQVTEAFRILLSDSRVKAVLVNIFGGIMKCDIIAGAIIAAFKEVGFHVPLVVRLEGTNVAQGKKMLADSGLNIATADGLTEAAKKVVAAAKGSH
ncbi:MAG TPA: ADP-forming succinate--CoA ligase subunit beta [Planctomycetales bacterium]|jgi:succinyl-CoA synthetase beta subunit|nr:ADP-forming succinate--CoA ligase subunit beta [Planctomycetales bacterium]